MKRVEYFVYEWTNSLGKRYIGYHKGYIDDGYISSSGSEKFWKDWKDPAIEWNREIIQVFDNAEDAINLERQLLAKHKKEIFEGNTFYNNSVNVGILFTTEVRDKISSKAKQRPSGFKGKKHNRICCLNCHAEISATAFEQHYLSKRCQGIPYYTKSEKQRVITQEHRKKLSEALAGKKKSTATRQKMSKSRKGNILSTETKQKISKALTGENNHSYGTIWITNGIQNKRIRDNNDIPDGWVRGRK